MPPKKQEVHIETIKSEITKQVEPKKKGRTMSAEMLEKLKVARELALKARREGKQIEQEHKEIKETFGNKLNDVETFQKLKKEAKDIADDEVKKNEIVAINKKLEDLHSKFEGYLQEKTVRRQQKSSAKQEMTAKEIVRELPVAISQKMLEEELKRQEAVRWRKRYYGV